MSPFFIVYNFELFNTNVNFVAIQYCLQMLIQERIQLILKMHNLTPSSFADQLGVQRSNVSHVLNGRNKPGIDFLEKIITTFPRVNAHWLITGEMPKNQQYELTNEVKEMKSAEVKPVQVTGSAKLESAKIVRIVTFYEDGTFENAIPREVN